MRLLTLLLLAALAHADEAADALAAKVAAAAGNPYAVGQIAFTWQVVADGEVKGRRSHVWCPRDGVVYAQSGEEKLLLDAATGKPVRMQPDDARAEEAWGAFINDSYWLLAPSKVLDDGVQRALDAQGRLVLTFEGVGLTPGDRYAMTVDPETHLVTRWDFVLQGGREGWTTWEGHVARGPLTLATDHVGEGGFRVAIPEVTVEDRCTLVR